MPKPIVRPIWTPADAREAINRASTIAGVRVAAQELPAEVGESAVLADLVDREVGR